MKFQMPETLEGLSLENVSELHAAALSEAQELNAIPQEEITDEQSTDFVDLMGHVSALSERKAELAGKAEAFAAAREQLASFAVVEEPAPEPAEPAEPAPVAAEEPTAVVAGASKSFASKAAQNAPEPTPPAAGDEAAALRSRSLSIVAAANVPGFQSGAAIADFGELAKAYAGRAKSFANGGRGSRSGRRPLTRSARKQHTLSSAAQRFSVAKLNKPETEFTITEDMSAERQYDMIKAAANERRLGGQSLLASGSWCAPSEQLWGFLELESTEGMLSIPELIARRGGISHTKGPQLGDLLVEANLGFVQTEAEAEAGDVKPVFDIECPDWDEVRLDAVGYALRAGLLTNAAYPELIRRYLGLALIVHQRRINALTIGRISSTIGTATAFTQIGSTAADVLQAIELSVLRLRYLYSMSPNATVEGVFPLWTRAAIRADLSRRTGVDMISIPDSMIDGWFRDRGVLAQHVYDYQNLNATAVTNPGGTAAWTSFPDELEFMLYPAGSFVRLGFDVIDMDTVYDVDDLTQNQFMAAFFEEGFNVANTGGSGIKMTVGLPNLNGETGFPAVGAGEGVSIPVAA